MERGLSFKDVLIETLRYNHPVVSSENSLEQRVVRNTTLEDIQARSKRVPSNAYVTKAYNGINSVNPVEIRTRNNYCGE